MSITKAGKKPLSDKRPPNVIAEPDFFTNKLYSRRYKGEALESKFKIIQSTNTDLILQDALYNNCFCRIPAPWMRANYSAEETANL